MVACQTPEKFRIMVLAAAFFRWIGHILPYCSEFHSERDACDHHGCYGRIEVWCSTRHFFAILVTLASNAVLGHGWWSLFQMIAWGSVAAVASVVNVYDQRGNLR